MKIANFEFVKNLSPRKVVEGIENFVLMGLKDGITIELNRKKKECDLVLVNSMELDECISLAGSWEEFNRRVVEPIKHSFPSKFHVRVVKRSY